MYEVAATVIQFSTRGTVGSHNWQIRLIETSLAEKLPCVRIKAERL